LLIYFLEKEIKNESNKKVEKSEEKVENIFFYITYETHLVKEENIKK
jgi:hypothetical protein